MMCAAEALSDRDRRDAQVLLTEPPMNPHNNTKLMFQNMLEKYQFAGAQVTPVTFSGGTITAHALRCAGEHPGHAGALRPGPAHGRGGGLG